LRDALRASASDPSRACVGGCVCVCSHSEVEEEEELRRLFGCADRRGQGVLDWDDFSELIGWLCVACWAARPHRHIPRR
jgi:hypothetical protein